MKRNVRLKFIVESVAVLAVTCGVPLSPAFVRAEDTTRISITGMTMKDLMDVEVSSASKKSQALYKTPSAVYVLTSEDIRRSGVTNVPDALRLVPGVDVARIDANKYAISVRGLTARSSNKLLVLVDGRPIYDPLFSGVFWESRDVAPENIERIEVIRGPGGSTWGANAVNGVINIITKDADDTQGVTVSGVSGTKDDAIGLFRLGWKLGESTPMRAYIRYQDEGVGYANPAPHDERVLRESGIRVDHRTRGGEEFSLNLSGFNADVGEGQTVEQANTVEQNGASAVANWKRRWSPKNELSATSYLDYFEYDGAIAREKRIMAQIELRHQFAPLKRHRLTWGTSYTHMTDDVWYAADDLIQPRERDDQTYSLFFEDEITIVADKLIAALGTKLEQNDYSGFEYQPSASATWTANRSNVLWTSVSRAVRIPSRLESDIVYNGADFGANFEAENLIAYQLGHRARLHENVTLDEVAFIHDYDDMITLEGDGFHNNMYGESHGVEVSARWQAARRVKVEANYASFHLDLGLREGVTPESTIRRGERTDPRNVASLRYYVDVSRFIEFDGAFRYVDNWRAIGVPSYLVGDMRLGWHPNRYVDVSINARDLFNPHHDEQNNATGTEVEPTVYAKLMLWVR